MSGLDQPTKSDASKDTVFLSYSRDDQPLARKVLDLLQAAGISVWWDAMLEGGVRFHEVTEDKLENADAVVVLWSKISVASHWVHDEATRGRDRGALVPVSIDGTEPPLGFRQFQWITLPAGGDWNSDTPEIRRLISAVEGKRYGSGAAPTAPMSQVGTTASLPSTSPVISRRTAIVGGAALAVGAGGLTAWNAGMFSASSMNNKLAVMPFRVLGDPGEGAYFLEGFAAEIRSQLARNPLLHVAAKTSSNALRDSGETAGEICGKLSVEYLLTGDIRREDNALVGGAELIEGDTDRVLREFPINGPVDSIFAIQSQIAAGIVGLLAGADDRSSTGDQSGGTQNVAAYDALLRGQELYDSGVNEASDRAALAKFDEAIRLDPDYAAAHARRGRTLTLIHNLYGDPSDRETNLGKAVEAARRAIAIAPDYADGHAVLGFIFASGDLDMKSARGPYAKSYDLGKGDADILSRYAIFRSRIGDTNGAVAAIGAAEALDPLNARVFRFAGNIAYHSGQYGAAIAQFEKALSLQAGLSSYHYLVGLAQMARGDLAGAKTSFETETRFVWQKTGLAIVEDKLGNRAAAEGHFAELQERQGDKSHYQYLQVHAQWGNEAEALEALDTGWNARDAGLAQLYRDPLLDPVRGTDGYRQIVARMGFE
ncbi:MAG: TIR domain-containing protein [Pseudomonadota bacterium]